MYQSKAWSLGTDIIREFILTSIRFISFMILSLLFTKSLLLSVIVIIQLSNETSVDQWEATTDSNAPWVTGVREESRA